MRVLSRLPFAAVGQPVKAPFILSGDGIEARPEDGGDTHVGRVAEHAAQLAVLDLPGDLRPELEVEPLVVDRPALVRAHEDAVVDIGEEVVEGALARLEVEVGHAYERHATPAVGAHRPAGALPDQAGRLAGGKKPGE